MKAVAFCPGHITGFFTPKQHDNALQCGSQGAGICIDKGAVATVTAVEGKRHITATVNGLPAPVTESALNILLQDRELEVTAEVELQLPCGAGFGTSAAGSISATMALCDILSINTDLAINASHLAEIKHNTGLGDVPALSRSGITFRVREGVVPYGKIVRIPGSPKITACVLDDSLNTAEILTNSSFNERISLVGEYCIAEMKRNPTLDNLMTLSKKFMLESNLASDAVKNALMALREIPSSMIMLGNSVFAIGDGAEEILINFGRVYNLHTDLNGPRILTHTE